MRPHVALLVLGIAACDGDEPGPADCETLGCPAGSSCREGACLDDEPEPYRVILRARMDEPASESEWASEEVTLVEPEITTANFRFHRRVSLRGEIAPAEGEEEGARAVLELERDAPVAGRPPIRVSTPITIGEPFEIDVPSLEDRPADDPRGPELYRMTVRGLGPPDDFAPLHRELGASHLERRVEESLPATVRVRGVLVSRTQRIEGARIWAEDPVTGRQISTTAVTTELGETPEGEPTGGEFELRVPEDQPEIVVRAAESLLRSGRALPTMEFLPPIVVDTLPFDEEEGVREIPLAVLDVPGYGTLVRLSGTVEGLSRAGGRIAVAGAMLRFLSRDLGAPDLADVPGVVELLTRSERLTTGPPSVEGAYAAHLPPGTYDVELTPPAEDRYSDLGVGIVSQYVNAAPGESDQAGIVLEVPPRFSRTGVVEDAGGGAIAEARVDFLGGGDLADPELAGHEGGVRSVRTHTSGDGSFLVLVDGGHFDVVVRPEPERRLPWGLFRGVEAVEDSAEPERFVVPPGRRLSGVVLDERGAASAGVEVEVWCLPDDGTSLVCGTARTDGGGRYEVLLPAALDAD